MLKDKDYVRTKQGMLFNITGYQHPTTGYYASLKYIDGSKWTDGYRAACGFLRSNYPQFVDSDCYIQVPADQIVDAYYPTKRWQELIAEITTGTANGLQQEAFDLGQTLISDLDIDSNAIGITDSLLWGAGHDRSDIDLVVVGRENVRRLQSGIRELYRMPEFNRPDPRSMTCPYGMEIDDWPEILSRKWHMGSFNGRLFSVRGVLKDSETDSMTCHATSATKKRRVDFKITDADDSLLFPAVYRNEKGDELIDYSVVYEGALRPGDRIVGDCDVTSVAKSDRQIQQYVLSDLDSVCALPPD